MPLQANQTGLLVADGSWQKIATTGECVVECSDRFSDALMVDDGSVPTVGHQHAASHVDQMENTSAWTIPAGGCLWVKADPGARFVITANAPTA